MKRSLPLYFGLLLLALSLGCQNKEEAIYPTEQALTSSVYASAVVQPDSLYLAYAPVLGILEEQLVEEGDLVQKGQVLLRIENTPSALSAENARLNLSLARDNYKGENTVLQALEEEIASARLQVKNDSLNYFRQKKLWEQKIGSQQDFDRRELAYQLSKNQLLVLQNRYARQASELETLYRQAQNQYRSSESVKGDFEVKSKINGRVYALYKEPGELVQSQQAVAAIGHPERYILELQVDEVDIVQLSIGQQAYITLDAYGQEVFEAQVHKIYPRKNERSQTFLVEARFKQAPKQLYPGLSGEANILVAQKDNCLTIPKAYLSGSNTVLTDKGEVEVVLGLENLEWVEVLSGIDASTPLYLPGR